MHKFWNGLLTTSGDETERVTYAVSIQKEYPRRLLKELTPFMTPEAWCLESRAAAIEKAYLRGQLQGSTNADIAPFLPQSYTNTAKTAAERQAALAGYRLADEIRKIL